jgi:hypothetical protein
MNLINVVTGEKIEGKIEKLSLSKVKKLKGHKAFLFDWSLEVENNVYCIREKESEVILGLISLKNIVEEFRIHINLIESASEYRGKNKKIENIPGCLIALACRMAFESGYGGFVSLISKTKLVTYYQTKFGFTQIGYQMAVFMESSQSIIDKYLKDEKV